MRFGLSGLGNCCWAGQPFWRRPKDWFASGCLFNVIVGRWEVLKFEALYTFFFFFFSLRKCWCQYLVTYFAVTQMGSCCVNLWRSFHISTYRLRKLFWKWDNVIWLCFNFSNRLILPNADYFQSVFFSFLTFALQMRTKTLFTTYFLPFLKKVLNA